MKERLEKNEIKFPEQEKCGDMIGIVWKIYETAGKPQFLNVSFLPALLDHTT